MTAYHKPDMTTRIDLHTHSTHSDGVLSPEELVARAAARQVSVLALTDHDTMAGCAAAGRACDAAGIHFVPGAELTAGWRGQEIHVVGLALQPEAPPLKGYLDEVLARRRARVRAIGEKLRGERTLAGFDPSETVLREDVVPTRMHVARELVRAGFVRDTQSAFDRYLARRTPGYVPQEWPTVEAAVEAIVAAGGLAVLAHPHRYKLSNGALREFCARFREAGGAGMEVSIAGQSPNDLSRLARLARATGLAGSVASDFHEPGLPWRPVGRSDKLPEGVEPLLGRLAIPVRPDPDPLRGTL
jgi:predicted metal-dependent phosphoesterase TrpH